MSKYHRTFAVANGMHKTQNHAIRYTIWAAHKCTHIIVVVNVSRCMDAVYTRQWDANTHTLCATTRAPLPVPPHANACRSVKVVPFEHSVPPNMLGIPYAVCNYHFMHCSRRVNTECRSNIQYERINAKIYANYYKFAEKKHKNNYNYFLFIQ